MPRTASVANRKARNDLQDFKKSATGKLADDRKKRSKKVGECIYCGANAGLFRKSHKLCATKAKDAEREISKLCRKAALRGEGLEELPRRARTLASGANIKMSDRKLNETLIEGWCRALEDALSDKHLSNEEIQGLNKYLSTLGISNHEISSLSSGHLDLFKFGLKLRTLQQGKIPRYEVSGSRLPFNLMKSEAVISVIKGVVYHKEVTRREYQGSSMGASVRVAKGVYIRPGSYRGQTIENTSMERQDTGTLGLTTKHLYFVGDNTGRSFRIRLEKIVSLTPYEDALGVMRDTARAKPETFTMENYEAWFLINAIYAIQDSEKITLPSDDTPTLEDLLEEMEDENSDDASGHLGGFFAMGN